MPEGKNSEYKQGETEKGPNKDAGMGFGEMKQFMKRMMRSCGCGCGDPASPGESRDVGKDVEGGKSSHCG
jgi:hypothetical protein